MGPKLLFLFSISGENRKPLSFSSLLLLSPLVSVSAALSVARCSFPSTGIPWNCCRPFPFPSSSFRGRIPLSDSPILKFSLSFVRELPCFPSRGSIYGAWNFPGRFSPFFPPALFSNRIWHLRKKGCCPTTTSWTVHKGLVGFSPASFPSLN